MQTDICSTRALHEKQSSALPSSIFKDELSAKENSWGFLMFLKL